MQFSTKAVHTGVNQDGTWNSVITPIYPSSTFRFEKIGVTKGFDYTRSGNPTRRAVEDNLAALEGGASGRCTATGMAAVTGVLHLLSSGDHVIAGHDIYGGTYRLLSTYFPKLGIQVEFINMGDLDLVAKSFKSNTKMVWIETPSNPLLNIVDIRAVCQLAQSHGALSVVDNTFLSPYFQRPLELGADLVVHSTTKYINGHSDVVGGVIISKTEEWGEKVHAVVNALGLGESPFDAWLVLRGVKTLALRMEKHQENAIKVAQFLAQHPKVAKVYYPGLEGHPGRDLQASQSSGWGAMMSFDAAPGVDLDRLFAGLKLYSLAESLGGVESLIEAPWYMSHASMTEEARIKAGILPTNVRVSLGIEDAQDLIDDLAQSLAQA